MHVDHTTLLCSSGHPSTRTARLWGCLGAGQREENVERLPSLESHLLALPCPLVLDHIAHNPQPEGVASAGFRTAQKLVDKGNTWVTLSGPYVDTKVDTKPGAPSFDDVAPVAKAFIGMAPERMLWGTDWPHPTEKGVKPDDANLVDVIAQWIGRPEWQRMAFVTNAEGLYRFG